MTPSDLLVGTEERPPEKAMLLERGNRLLFMSKGTEDVIEDKDHETGK